LEFLLSFFPLLKLTHSETRGWFAGIWNRLGRARGGGGCFAAGVVATGAGAGAAGAALLLKKTTSEPMGSGTACSEGIIDLDVDIDMDIDSLEGLARSQERWYGEGEWIEMDGYGVVWCGVVCLVSLTRSAGPVASNSSLLGRYRILCPG
jgi:hypothetical protein